MTRFSQVIDVLRDWATNAPLQPPPGQQQQPVGPRAVFVRDLRGRVRLVANWTSKTNPQPALDLHALDQRLGSFSPGVDELLWHRDKLSDDAADILQHSDLRMLTTGPDVGLLERQLIGVDWLRIANINPAAPRLSFFGLKGGVGRSTALAFLAGHLTRKGKRVLAVDLDWESPGLGALLLPADAEPEFGVVDWFVEDLVGQADEALLQSSFARTAEGIVVCPAFGKGDEYSLDKLSRAYVEAGGHAPANGGLTGALRRYLDQIEARHQPDVILIDSRAGLHDLAAAALTQLGAEALLFVADTRQNWEGLRVLFTHWQKRPEALKAFRDRLHLIQALSPVPLNERPAADSLFRQKAYSLCVDTIYEQNTGDPSAWSFDEADTDAPHAPVPIRWNAAAQQVDPGASPEVLQSPEIRVAFEEFLEQVSVIAFPS